MSSRIIRTRRLSRINDGPIREVSSSNDPGGKKRNGYYGKSNFQEGWIEPWANEVRSREELQGLSELSLNELRRYKEGHLAAGVKQFARALRRALPELVRRELRVNKPSPINSEYRDMREMIIGYVFQANLWPRAGFSKFKL